MSADLVLRNGRFTTLDCSNPAATAGAAGDNSANSPGGFQTEVPQLPWLAAKNPTQLGLYSKSTVGECTRCLAVINSIANELQLVRSYS
jgi:hypothetical protein